MVIHVFGCFCFDTLPWVEMYAEYACLVAGILEGFEYIDCFYGNPKHFQGIVQERIFV